MKFSKRSKFFFPFLFIFIISSILGSLLLSQILFSPDRQFERFTSSYFQNELSDNSLNLHYTLAHPEDYGISESDLSLGHISVSSPEKIANAYKSCEAFLLSLPYEKLSKENQITLDTLLLEFHTGESLQDIYFLREPLSPSLGIQAQLPVLLAEYSFQKKEDISNYLRLLTCIRPYFDEILAFEKEKADRGLFMSDVTLDRILKQCRQFTQDSEGNYLSEIFQEKLAQFPGLTEKEISTCTRLHKKILQSSVIPAYAHLMEGLSSLRSSGKNESGLSWYPNGQKYYLYLLQTQVGTYDSPEVIETRLRQQMLTDCMEYSQLLKKNAKQNPTADTSAIPEDPYQILETLQQKMQKDFPPISNVSYEIKYVPSSMERYLSPAFYLTPPIDTMIPNIIYINQYSTSKGLELFTTLGHEGFPGHLYQTQFFQQTHPDPLRFLLSSSGYIEGWATYVESFAYSYAPVDSDFSRRLWLKRSINLCLYSLVDLGIHYYGWTYEETRRYLASFGITEPSVTREIFQYIVETPGNYLKYYWGYLNFLDLQASEKARLGSKFQLRDFHKRLLEIGPVPFPILKKFL